MKRLGQELLHQGAWRSFVATQVQLPDGRLASYEHFASPGYDDVGVLAVVDDHLLLVRQPRPVVGARASLEIVCGGVEAGEQPMYAAHRELREETGYSAGRLELLRTYFVEPTATDSVFHLFVAHDVRYDPLPDAPDESLQVVRWPLANLEQAVTEVQEPMSLISLLLFAQRTAGIS
jgi:ADP-ribose pyrophosphatase